MSLALACAKDEQKEVATKTAPLVPGAVGKPAEAAALRSTCPAAIRDAADAEAGGAACSRATRHGGPVNRKAERELVRVLAELAARHAPDGDKVRALTQVLGESRQG